MKDFEDRGQQTAPSVQSALPRPLFVFGCERTGTTALLSLLNKDLRIVLGRERFKFVCSSLNPKLFEPEHFFYPEEHETNFLDQKYYDRLNDRLKNGTVKYLGDKNPLYFKHLERIEHFFPTAKYIVLFRGLMRVAASYNSRARNEHDAAWPATKDYRKAVKFWNQSLSNSRKLWFKVGVQRLFILPYEKFFSGDLRYLAALYEFLNLRLTSRIRRHYQRMTAEWPAREARPLELTAEEISYLEAHKDETLEEWFRNKDPLSI